MGTGVSVLPGFTFPKIQINLSRKVKTSGLICFQTQVQAQNKRTPDSLLASSYFVGQVKGQCLSAEAVSKFLKVRRVTHISPMKSVNKNNSTLASRLTFTHGEA